MAAVRVLLVSGPWLGKFKDSDGKDMTMAHVQNCIGTNVAKHNTSTRRIPPLSVKFVSTALAADYIVVPDEATKATRDDLEKDKEVEVLTLTGFLQEVASKNTPCKVPKKKKSTKKKGGSKKKGSSKKKGGSKKKGSSKKKGGSKKKGSSKKKGGSKKKGSSKKKAARRCGKGTHRCAAITLSTKQCKNCTTTEFCGVHSKKY